MTLPTDWVALELGVVGRDPQPCPDCGDTGWLAFPDPFMDGDLIDARCPTCARGEPQ